jgi:hypothetical protein
MGQFQKFNTENEDLRFFLKLRFHEDENNLENQHEAQLSFVDKVPWKKELRSFR